MPRDIMSEQKFNIRFVKEVQKHPSLYNFELPSYTRKDISDQAWEDVGRTMSMTPSACREKWRNLRSVLMRTIRAPPRSTTGKKKPYYLADVMQFVVPYMRPVAMAKAAKEKQIQQAKEQREANKKPIEVEQIKLEVQDDDSDEWCVQSVGEEDEEEEEKEIIVTRKRPAQDDSVTVAKMSQPSSSSMILESDYVRSFLNSLLPELNEMNSAQFKNFKRRVLLLIDNIMTEIPASPRRPINDEYIM